MRSLGYAGASVTSHRMSDNKQLLGLLTEEDPDRAERSAVGVCWANVFKVHDPNLRRVDRPRPRQNPIGPRGLPTRYRALGALCPPA